MDACRDCGTTLASDARYCSHCGRATSDDLELLGADSAVTSRDAVRRPGRPSGPVLALLGVVAVLVVIWVAVGSSSDADADDERAEEATEEADGDGTATDRSTTSRRARSTTSALEADTTTPTISDGPVLGEEVGLSLLVGGRTLHWIDLDTGTVTEYSVTGLPIFASGGWLVLQSLSLPRASAVPLNDPDGAAPVNLPGSDLWPGSIDESDVPGNAWVFNGDWENPGWSHVVLATGDIVEEIETAVPWFGPGLGNAELATSPDGGVYEWTGSSYRQIGTGGLLAANEERLLVTTCSGPSTCELRWLDRRSGEPLDLPTPPSDTYYFGGTLSATGRVVSLWGQGEPLLYDVERGEPIGIEIGALFEPGQLVLSPNDRYLATVGARLAIHDLDTGETIELELPTRGRTAAVFVENG